MQKLGLVVLGQLVVSIAFASGGAAPRKLEDTSGVNPAYNEKAYGADIEHSMNKLWLGKYEPEWVRVLLWGPRLIANDAIYLATGETANRIGNTAATVRYAVTGEMRTAAMRSAESVLNPLGDFEGVASDTVSLLASPLYAGFRTTTRVQTCTMNLFNIFFPAPNPVNQFNPTKHVGFVVDQSYESHDPGGGGYFLQGNIDNGGTLVCKMTPVRDNISDSLGIERIYCMDHVYGAAGYSNFYEQKTSHVDYDFFRKNCAGYTKASLEGAGFGFPTFPNLGIGLDAFNWEQKATLKNSEESCSNHVSKLKDILKELELGQSLSPDNADYLALGAMTETYTSNESVDYETSRRFAMRLAPDTIVQLYVSAARGRNTANRELVQKSISLKSVTDVYFEDASKKDKLRSNTTDDLGMLMTGIDSEAKAWLAKNAPDISDLQDRLNGKTPVARVSAERDLSTRDFAFTNNPANLRLEGLNTEPVLRKRSLVGECDDEGKKPCEIEEEYATDMYTVQMAFDKAAGDSQLVNIYFRRDELGTDNAKRLDDAIASLKSGSSGAPSAVALNTAKAAVNEIFTLDTGNGDTAVAATTNQQFDTAPTNPMARGQKVTVRIRSKR